MLRSFVCPPNAPLSLPSLPVGDGEFEPHVTKGWWQGEVVVGPAPWHRSSTSSGLPNWSNWTSVEFDDHYQAIADGPAGSEAAAIFSVAGALVAAIEESGSLETAAVAAVMRRRYHQGLCASRRASSVIARPGAD